MTEEEKEKEFQLTKIHQARAREICKEAVIPRYKKKVCKWCKGTAVKDIDKHGSTIPCGRCVQASEAFRLWKEYCVSVEDKEMYAHYFGDKDE